jgi:hypothetical protein
MPNTALRQYAQLQLKYRMVCIHWEKALWQIRSMRQQAPPTAGAQNNGVLNSLLFHERSVYLIAGSDTSVLFQGKRVNYPAASCGASNARTTRNVRGKPRGINPL